MVQAYVLVQTEVGRAAEVAAAVMDLHGVVAAENVTGPYDVVVRVQASSIEDLGPLVLTRMARVDGITRTVTCTVMTE